MYAYENERCSVPGEDLGEERSEQQPGVGLGIHIDVHQVLTEHRVVLTKHL